MIEKIDDSRLQPLWSRLSPGTGECPFVVAGPAADRVAVRHYSGGRDATYVVVASESHAKITGDFTVTIRYAPHVAGTMLIYDLTAETMQGKARPFDCRLRGGRGRVFAVLPFQLEETRLNVTNVHGRQQLEVAFLDARGERVEAALPFHWRLADCAGQAVASQYAATDQRGRAFVELPGSFRDERETDLIVRSLLSGQERRARGW